MKQMEQILRLDRYSDRYQLLLFLTNILDSNTLFQLIMNDLSAVMGTKISSSSFGI